MNSIANRLRIELPSGGPHSPPSVAPKAFGASLPQSQIKNRKSKIGGAYDSVKEGSFTAPIYKCADGNYSGAYYQGGKRKSIRRADLGELKEFLRQKIKDLADGKIYMANMTQEDRAALECAKRNLHPTGKSIEFATADYAEADKILVGASHVEAALYYRQHHGRAQALPEKTSRQILDEMLLARKSDGHFKNTLDDYRSRLGRFADHFQCPLMAITAHDINTWLRTLPVQERKRKLSVLKDNGRPPAPRYIGRRTRNNYRDSIRELYRYAKQSGYLPKTWEVFDDVVRVKNEPITVKIFTPGEAVALLAEARPNLVPYLAIAFFATTRNEEMCASDPTLPRLDWRQIDFKARRIHVLPEVARKIGRDRLIPMPPNLIAWLKPFAKESGPVCSLKNVSNALAQTAARAGVKWISNGPRKSSISYRLALLQDFKKTAFEAGTSEERILLNYKKTVPQSEARRWYQIFPAPAGVIHLKQAAA